MKRRTMTMLAAALALGVAAQSAPAATLKSPDKVKEALRLLAYVQADMASKLPNKAFNRLPHENQEFQEAAPALLDAVAGEPAAFRSKVEAQLKVARAAASHVAEVSATNDAVAIIAAVAEVDEALKPLNALFPAELRPVPGQLGQRPGRRDATAQNGPPKDLR